MSQKSCASSQATSSAFANMKIQKCDKTEMWIIGCQTETNF